VNESEGESMKRTTPVPLSFSEDDYVKDWESQKGWGYRDPH